MVFHRSEAECALLVSGTLGVAPHCYAKPAARPGQPRYLGHAPDGETSPAKPNPGLTGAPSGVS